MFQVKKVDVDKKRNYFIVTTRIYHHDFIQLINFKDCDYIECYEDRAEYGMFIGNKEKVIKVIRSNES